MTEKNYSVSAGQYFEVKIEHIDIPLRSSSPRWMTIRLVLTSGLPRVMSWRPPLSSGWKELCMSEFVALKDIDTAVEYGGIGVEYME